MYPFWKSRKFWLAVFGVIQAVVLNYFAVPESVWQAIAAMVAVLIGSIALEDAGEKAGAAWLGVSDCPPTPDKE